MIAVDEFNLDSALLPLHQALINFCQARNDAVGILTLPAHFEKRQCIEWQERLRGQLGLPSRSARFNDVRDVADLSYVAVYHPWMLVRDTTAHDSLRPVSPDGVVCGMIAAREHNRQVWVAPANVPVHGALGLTPHFSEDDWADLYAAQFNLIREEARDMRVMSALTLSDERSLLQLSVRRLLIQLRKAAVEKGMDYVFASNHDHTRNAIRLSLENLLRFMFERGAFAGSTQPSAFRITTDISVNPLQSIEQGRLVAQIQVAPSEPLEFITVLLTRTGEDLLQATEV
jgi:phage tail sheath protein FI